MNNNISQINLEEILPKSEYNDIAIQILHFFVPLALSIPQLRDNPDLMQETIKATSKTGITDVATEADRYVQSQIQNKTPKDWDFWGEEDIIKSEINNSESRWLLITDPIEGTNNFKERNDDQWGSVIALIDKSNNNIPVIGIIAHPTKRIIYLGIKGSGSYVLIYGKNYELLNFSKMLAQPEIKAYAYNNSPHFVLNSELGPRVRKFFEMGNVNVDTLTKDDLQSIGKILTINGQTFHDPESGALEAVRYTAGFCFKTSQEMAAVEVILTELGGIFTDCDFQQDANSIDGYSEFGKPWNRNINTMIYARNRKEYDFIRKIYIQCL
jgi:fructose-1,6-bisphosphatase/inositol monophosphatase family enzyme